MKHPIDSRIDWVFKALLGAERNRRWLIDGLNAILVGELPAPIPRSRDFPPRPRMDSA